MSITLRTSTNTSTSQTYGYATKTAPLTAEEVDKNFITLKQKCDELATDYTTTFNTDGSLKDGAVTSAGISDGSVTTDKIKDRAVGWSDQRNIIYLTDTSAATNIIEGTLNNYEANSGLTALPAGTVIYFKPANENTAGVTITVKDLNTTTNDTTTLLSLTLTKQLDAPMVTADLKEGGVYAAFYDGTTLQLVNTLQDPTVEIKESISRVQTFGPLEWEVQSLPTTGNLFDGKSTGLTDYPTTVVAMLKCTSPDDAYTEGDLVPIALAKDTNRDPGFTVRAQQTEVKVARSSDSGGLTLPKGSGTQVLNLAKWKVVVRGTFQNDSTYSPAYVDRALSYTAAYPTGGITFGNYLYIFSSQNASSTTANPLYKINLITNKVIYIGSTNGYQNPSILQYSANNKLQASSVSVDTAGSGYKVGDVVELPTSGTESGTYTIKAKFVVKTITGGGGTGPVGEVYEVTDATGVGQVRGEYTVTPANPVTTTGGTGNGLKLTVNWSSINQARIYFSAYKYDFHYIEPNNSDNPETISNLSEDVSWGYNCQVIVSGDYYGFDLSGDRLAALNNIYLYDIDDGTAVNSGNVLNLLTGTVSQLEGGENKYLEGLQWNPIKRRLYVTARRSNLMHIYTWGDGSTDLKHLFTNVSGTPPTYLKTIGIPAPGGFGTATGSTYHLNMIHVDWDTDTGEEKSITVSRYAAMGTVTRAAWKED